MDIMRYWQRHREWRVSGGRRCVYQPTLPCTPTERNRQSTIGSKKKWSAVLVVYSDPSFTFHTFLVSYFFVYPAIIHESLPLYRLPFKTLIALSSFTIFFPCQHLHPPSSLRQPSARLCPLARFDLLSFHPSPSHPQDINTSLGLSCKTGKSHKAVHIIPCSLFRCRGGSRKRPLFPLTTFNPHHVPAWLAGVSTTFFSFFNFSRTGNMSEKEKHTKGYLIVLLMRERKIHAPWLAKKQWARQGRLCCTSLVPYPHSSSCHLPRLHLHAQPFFSLWVCFYSCHRWGHFLCRLATTKAPPINKGEQRRFNLLPHPHSTVYFSLRLLATRGGERRRRRRGEKRKGKLWFACFGTGLPMSTTELSKAKAVPGKICWTTIFYVSSEGIERTWLTISIQFPSAENNWKWV